MDSGPMSMAFSDGLGKYASAADTDIRSMLGAASVPEGDSGYAGYERARPSRGAASVPEGDAGYPGVERARPSRGAASVPEGDAGLQLDGVGCRYGRAVTSITRSGSRSTRPSAPSCIPRRTTRRRAPTPTAHRWG